MAGTALSPGDALGVLLTTETLLLAALALAVDLDRVGGRVRRWVIKPRTIGYAVLVAHVIVAIGAGFAWGQLYVPQFPTDIPTMIVAISIIGAVVIQPILTVFLGFGLRKSNP